VTPARGLHSLRIRALGLLTGVALALIPWALLAMHSDAGPAQSRSAARSLPAAVSPTGLAERAGVRVVRVAATGGGGLLDVRYQVVDPEAAAVIHDPARPPALVDERRGLVIGDLFMGHMHHGTPKAGLSYYLVFINPSDAVHTGDRVSVVLGNARLMHVRVQ
jgi:hypothetical protein